VKEKGECEREARLAKEWRPAWERRSLSAAMVEECERVKERVKGFRKWG